MKEAACAKVLRCEKHGMLGNRQVLWVHKLGGPQGAVEETKGNSVGEVRQEPEDERPGIPHQGVQAAFEAKGVNVSESDSHSVLDFVTPIDSTVHGILQPRHWSG